MPSQAATFFRFNGTSGVFGNDQVNAPDFADEFDLGSFAAGSYLFSGTISSSFQTNEPSQNIDFTDVRLNGTPFAIGTTGQFEFRYVADVPSGTSNMLRVSGTSGVLATYSGTINVSPPSVPEASSWMLMLAGFGLVGWALRRGRVGLGGVAVALSAFAAGPVSAAVAPSDTALAQAAPTVRFGAAADGQGPRARHRGPATVVRADDDDAGLAQWQARMVRRCVRSGQRMVC